MRIRWLVAGWALASAVRSLSRRTGVPVTASPASERSQAVFDWTWAFVLRPVAEGCRLIARSVVSFRRRGWRWWCGPCWNPPTW